MSNKTTLQSYNARINSNNTNLDTILQMAQSLPNGSGSNELIELLSAQITTFSNSELTTIKAYAFFNCTKLVTINLPNITVAQTYAFCNCSALKNISIPKVTTASTSAFQNTALEVLELPKVTTISANAFKNSKYITKLVLSDSSMCTLGNVSAFSGTPVESGTGYVYVPDTLVASYKSATNWSTYANQIKGISEL